MSSLFEEKIEQLNAPLSRSLAILKGNFDHNKFLTYQLPTTRTIDASLKRYTY